jgi:hypothetical protein
MSFIKSLLGSRYLLWVILAIPSFGFVSGLISEVAAA